MNGWIYLKLNDCDEVFEWAPCTYTTPEDALKLAEQTADRWGVMCQIRTGPDRQVVARASPPEPVDPRLKNPGDLDNGFDPNGSPGGV
jgi:hypothetical protein